MPPLSFCVQSSSPLIDDATMTRVCSANSRLDQDDASMNCSTHTKPVPLKSCLKKEDDALQFARRKRVQFAPFSQQYSHIHKNDFSKEEKQASFMNADDVRAMNIDINCTLRQMRAGKLPNGEDTYFRGLEIDLPGPKRECLERRDLAMYAIQEYEADHDTHHLSDEWVDSIYRNITKKSTQLGLKAACYDQVQAEQVYKEEVMPAARRHKREHLQA